MNKEKMTDMRKLVEQLYQISCRQYQISRRHDELLCQVCDLLMDEMCADETATSEPNEEEASSPTT